MCPEIKLPWCLWQYYLKCSLSRVTALSWQRGLRNTSHGPSGARRATRGGRDRVKTSDRMRSSARLIANPSSTFT